MTQPFESCRRITGGARRGQSLVESVFVILLLCLCFLAFFQYAHLFACKTILNHAATRAARARTVGFNRWMVEKSALVAAIPASGDRLTPPPAGLAPAVLAALQGNRVGEVWDRALITPAYSAGSQIELARIPDFMDSVNAPTSQDILDYELWERTDVDLDEPLSLDGSAPGTLSVTVRQRQPLLLSLGAMALGELRNADADETLAIEGYYSIESHYPLYMENMNW